MRGSGWPSRGGSKRVLSGVTETAGGREEERDNSGLREKEMRRAWEKDDARETHEIFRHPARVPRTTPQRSEPASAYLG